jgi:hypothetical protein
VVHNKSSFKNHVVFPQKYYTTIAANYTGFFATNTMTLGAGLAGRGYCNVLANSLYAPFNTTAYTYVPTSTTFACTSGLGVSIYDPPIGYAELSVLYGQYRVHSTKITVSYMPGGIADTVQLIVFPLANEPIPNSAAGNVDMSVISGQPYARSKVCTSNNTMKGNTVSLSMPIHKILGLTKAQYLNGNYDNMGTQPAANYALFGIFVQQLNGQGNTLIDMFTITLEMKIEMSGPIRQFQ